MEPLQIRHCVKIFIGYPSKDFVYILDIYLAKSQKSSLGIAMIYKKLKHMR